LDLEFDNKTLSIRTRGFENPIVFVLTFFIDRQLTFNDRMLKPLFPEFPDKYLKFNLNPSFNASFGINHILQVVGRRFKLIMERSGEVYVLKGVFELRRLSGLLSVLIGSLWIFWMTWESMRGFWFMGWFVGAGDDVPSL
jgi:hypothetical protein